MNIQLLGVESAGKEWMGQCLLNSGDMEDEVYFDGRTGGVYGRV